MVECDLWWRVLSFDIWDYCGVVGNGGMEGYVGGEWVFFGDLRMSGFFEWFWGVKGGFFIMLLVWDIFKI